MFTLKVVTLNLWGEQPPLARRMQLAVEGLRALAPDVVGLQEVRQVPGTVPNQAATLATALGMHYYFEPATPWGGGDEGLAILSRHPIVARRVHELPHARADRAAPARRRRRRHAGGPASTSTPRTSTTGSPTATSARIRSSPSTNSSPPRPRSCRRSCAATSTPPPTPTRSAFCAGCTPRRGGAPSGRTRGSDATGAPTASPGRAPIPTPRGCAGSSAIAGSTTSS